MEKWIPSLPLWKSVSAHGKPPGNPSAPKLASRAVSHRPLPFPTAAKAEPGSTFPQALLRVILFTKTFSLFNSSGHFIC